MALPARIEKRRVLVVEDEGDVAEIVATNLRASGYDVRVVADGVHALEEVGAFAPDVVLLDLVLPDMSGFDVCRQIRSEPPGAAPASGETRRPAIIIVSARADEIDRVVGFEIGADDYVQKPFSVRELLLRVRARLPRTEPVESGAPGNVLTGAFQRRVHVGPLEVDLELYRVTVDGREIPVSPLEMHLLRYLAASHGAVCSREDLLSRVWHYDPDTRSRTVDTHIKRLRAKLGAAGFLIRTVRGKGYRLASYESPAGQRAAS